MSNHLFMGLDLNAKVPTTSIYPIAGGENFSIDV